MSFQQNSFFNPDLESYKQAAEGLKPTPISKAESESVATMKQRDDWADRVQDIIIYIEEDDKITIIIDALVRLHEDMINA